MLIIHATPWLGSALHSIIPISVTGAMQKRLLRPTLLYIGPRPRPSQAWTVIMQSRSSSPSIGCARFTLSMSSRTQPQRGVMHGLSKRGPFDGGTPRSYRTMCGVRRFSEPLIPLFVESCLSEIMSVGKKFVRKQDRKLGLTMCGKRSVVSWYTVRFPQRLAEYYHPL